MTVDPGRQDFFAGFDAFAQAVRRARGTSAGALRGEGLTFSQYALLSPLADGREARVSDLAAQADVAPSTATRILDALERRAIVRRERSTEDRRTITIALTPSGRRALTRQEEWMRGRQRRFYDGLPIEERELVGDLLQRMASLIDELAAGPPPTVEKSGSSPTQIAPRGESVGNRSGRPGRR